MPERRAVRPEWLSALGLTAALALLSFGHTVAARKRLYPDHSILDVVRFVFSPQAPTITVGVLPYDLTVSGTRLYVSNTGSGTVSVIDTVTDTVIATIPVGRNPGSVVVVGTKLYVANTDGNTVSVIDTANFTTLSSIAVGAGPYRIVAAGTKLYVGNSRAGTVSVIDTATDAVSATIRTGFDTGAGRETLGPDYLMVVGGKVYSSNRVNTVAVIDSRTDTVASSIGLPHAPLSLAATGSKLYVSMTSNAVAVIDTWSDRLETIIPTGPAGTIAGTVTFFGSKAYVTGGGRSVAVVDTRTSTVTSHIPVGAGLGYSITLGEKVYVVGSDDRLSVIDPRTDTVVDAVKVGIGRDNVLAVTASKVYVSNLRDGTVSVIDPVRLPGEQPHLSSFSTTSPSGSYAAGQSIEIAANFESALKPGTSLTVTLSTGAPVTLDRISGSKLAGSYVVRPGDQTPDLAVMKAIPASVNRLVTLDAITRNLGDEKNIVIGDFPSISVGVNPYGISSGVRAGGSLFFYVANEGSDTVSAIDALAGRVAATIHVGKAPYVIADAAIAGATYLYVTNVGSNDVSVIDTGRNAVVATIPVGVNPYYATAIGNRVYVTNSLSNTVSVIDAIANRVIQTIPVGVYPLGIKAHGAFLYVANFGDLNYGGGNYISVIDTRSNEVVKQIVTTAGRSSPRGVAVLGDRVYVTNYRSADLSVIETATNAMIATIPVGRLPRGILASEGKVYVGNWGDSTVSVIDAKTNQVAGFIDSGNTPAAMSVVGADIYVSRFQDGVVSKLRGLLRPPLPVPHAP